MRSIPPALAIALAPFAPPQSDIHRQAEEALRIRADLAIDRMKNSGELLAREIHRAHLEELKWSDQ
jgi:hypothetical protein